MSGARGRLAVSFRTRVTAALIGALLLVLGLSHLLVYRSARDAQFSQLRNHLMTIAQTASLLVDGDVLASVPPSREAVHSDAYRSVASKLRKVRELNPSIRFIYTLRRTEDPLELAFIVDLDPEPAKGSQRTGTAYPGDRYDATGFPEMLNGFEGPAADRRLVEDAWGVALSGYAPVRDSMGRAVAVLGVDMDAGDVRQAQEEAARKSLHVVVIGALLSLLAGFVIGGRLARRVSRLTEGVEAVSEGDLSRRVPEDGRDEIGALGTAFNRMTASLEESHRKLEAHFCNVIEALVRMLEAKDKYTQGHSERVGLYAQRIAVQMGLPAREAELIRRAGELHDIGKLAVHEHVLNKIEPLTAEEWEMIRRHPVTGYETLKSLGLDSIIMTSVHLHHERPDGTGYPGRLSGDQMGLYAQIIAVADAYDAMTTNRSYRKSRDRRPALEELRRCAGTQFNPAVVEALVRVFEEGDRFHQRQEGRT